jgi:hypothetical protein
MRAFLAALAIVSAVVSALATMVLPAYAQGMKGGSRMGADQKKEEPKKKVDDKGYKSSLERIPDQKFDPWGKIR